MKKLRRNTAEHDDSWKSEFDRSEQPHRRVTSPLRLLAAFLLGCIAGSALLYLYRPQTVHHYSARAMSSLKRLYSSFIPYPAPQGSAPHASTPEDAQPRDLRFSSSDVERAMEEVLQQRQAGIEQPDGQAMPQQPGRYEYEIELVSGALIYTDNVELFADRIQYTGERGLIISIKREEILKMKRRRVD